MADLLADLAARPWVRRAVKALHLPVPLPPRLPRARGPLEARPLEGLRIALGLDPRSRRQGRLTALLEAAGASAVSEAVTPADALVFDASGLAAVADLAELHRFFHPRVRGLGPGGRLLVVGPEAEPPGAPAEAVAVSAALEGFVRSLAKEIGRKGATAHLVRTGDAAAGHLDLLLPFLLSRRAAFLTGQPWTLQERLPVPEPSTPTQPLAGRTALVTGAARGIGAAVARRLSEEGARVLCLDRPQDTEALEAVARVAGGEVVPVDLSREDAPQAVRDAAGRAGGLDVVVHNAGVTRDKTLGRMPADAWDAVLGINLAAVVRVTDALLEDRTLSDGGRILCLSSVSGLAGNAGQSNYAASKAGVAGYVRALAPRLADRGIATAAVAPGFIETRMTAAIPVAQREVARRLSALGQGGLPEDVAELVTFLAGPGGAGLTGATVRACGGMFVGA